MNDDTSRDADAAGTTPASATPSSAIPRRRREPATIDGRADEVTGAAATPVSDPMGVEASFDEAQSVNAPPVVETPASVTEPVAASFDAEPTSVESDLEPAAAASPLPPASRSGLLPMALASFAGAAIALAGAWSWRTAAGDGDSGLAALDRRMSAAETRLGALPPADGMTALERRLAALETQTKALPVSAPASTLAAFEQRLSVLEKAPRGTAPAGPPDLDKRLAALENAASAPKSNERATESRIEAAPAPSVPPVDLKPLETRIAAVEQRLQPLQSSIAGSADAAKAATARVEQEAARSTDAARASARAVAAQSLALALARGAPLAAELDTLARLGVAADRIAALKPYAGAPAPSVPALASEFAALENRMLDTQAPAQDAGLTDRLWQATRRLVRVRPAGDTAGDSPSDLVARIEARLAAADLAGALAAFDLLPPAAKTVAADWATKARARQAADSAAAAILADSLAGLGRNPT